MLWQPYIKQNGEWIAAKLLQGFFGAPIESLAEISVSDVVRDLPSAGPAHVAYFTKFFTHERGLYMAVYAVSLAYSNNLAPLLMGFINDGQNLEWTFVRLTNQCAKAIR